MTYLVADDLPTAPAGSVSAALLARPGILQLPGAHNGRPALQAKRPGSTALYLSGAAMTASMGIPDLGMITVDEVCFFIRQIARATGLPLLVDGDTGYGEALNVMHMVRSFEDAGAGRRAYRGPVAAEEMRPPERQETGRSARHGRQDRRRPQGPPASVHHRAHRRRRVEGIDGAVAAPNCSWKPAPTRSSPRR
jgi:hypothetical protein